MLQDLHAEIQKQVQDTGTSIESLMEAGNIWEDSSQILRWYRQARGAQYSPTTEMLDKIIVQRAELYRCRPQEVLRVPLLVRQDDIEDRIPM